MAGITPAAPFVVFQPIATGSTFELAGKRIEVLPAVHTVPAVAYAALTGPLALRSHGIFLVLFGIGSLAGMAMFSAVIALPLSYTAPTLTWATRGFQALAGVFAIAIGIRTLVETGAVLFG